MSVLSDDFVEYEFPETIPLETVIDDYLETDVDEKFFLTSEKADKLIADLMEKGDLPYGDKHNLPCKNNYNRVDMVGNTVAGTLAARDYKGFGSGRDCQNGVIVRDEN